MREIYRNPIVYYLLIPLLVGIWPLLVWGVYLPRAEDDREKERALCIEGQTRIVEILQVDPDRIELMDANNVTREFAYGSEVDRVANLCRILAGNCSINASNIILSQGKKRQDARVKLTNVSIVQAAKFLYTIQSMWVNLTCENIKLTKKKGMPDQWDVDFRFVYYY